MVVFTIALGSVVIPAISDNIYSNALYTEKPIKVLDGAVRALQTPGMDKYCSSVSVEYKGSNYTVTNRHCCRAYGEYMKDIRFVGKSIETILYESEINDVCVMTSNAKKSIKIAKKPAKLYEKVLIMGYPRGQLLTPRFGHVLSTAKKICLNYDSGKRCERAIVSSNLIFPGNSGSPMVNMRGELVGLAYGGNWSISYAISVQLHNVKRALEYASKKKY